jgi:hypothetical protein
LKVSWNTWGRCDERVMKKLLFSPISKDTSNSSNQPGATCSPSCNGAPINTTGSNDVIIQCASNAGVSAIAAPYTNLDLGSRANSDGFANSINHTEQDSGTGPVLTTSVAFTFSVGAIAFTESRKPCTIVLLSAGPC